MELKDAIYKSQMITVNEFFFPVNLSFTWNASFQETCSQLSFLCQEADGNHG